MSVEHHGIESGAGDVRTGTSWGPLPSRWEVKRLDRLAVKIQDGTHFSPKSTHGPFRYVTSKNIRYGHMDLSDCGWISRKEHDAIYARCDVRAGDLLLTKDGANTGNAAINSLTEEFSLLSSVALIRCDGKSLHANYLLQYLLSPICQQRIKDLMSGNAITRLTVEKIKAFEIPVPETADEQRRIAEILDAMDDAIRHTEVLVTKLKKIKAGLVNDLLTRGIDENGELRKPTPEHLPTGWKLEALSAISAKLITYGIVQPGPHQVGGIPFIQTKDLRSVTLDPRLMDRTTYAIANAYERSQVFTNDIVVGIRATVGDAALVPETLDGANISRGVARISPKLEYNAAYILWAIRSQRTQNAIRYAIKGSTYAEVTLPALRNIDLPIPTRDEQDLIEERITAHERRIESECETLKKLQKVKAGLTHDLFTGKVRISVEEVAP